MIGQTSTGWRVFAINAMEDPATRQKIWTGKIRFDEKDPGKDRFFDWRRSDFGDDGEPINHDMGYLILKDN